MGTIIHNHIHIAATPTAVWEVLADLPRLADYDPVVTTSVLVGDRHEGVGARRRCDAKQGRYFIEEVTEWAPPSRLQFSIIECNLPTRDLTHTYTLEETPSGTRVTQAMVYEMKFGPLGWALNELVLRRKSDTGIKGFFAGLKTTVENEPDRTTP